MTYRNINITLALSLAAFGLFSIPHNAQAISNDCKVATLYEQSLNITPTSGQEDTEIQIEMKFRWKNELPQCLNTKLLFDLSYSGSSWFSSRDIAEYPMGTVGTNWVTRTAKVRINTLPGIPAGTTFESSTATFQMRVEDGDFTGAGDNVTALITKDYALKIGDKVCGYVVSNRYSCVSGSKTATDCSALAECRGKSCQKLDSNKCGQLVNPSSTQPPTSVAPQSYSFEIKNPLGGGPSNLLDLVNIAATWLFNIAIPVAVILILYAGFLMLTAGDNPGKFKKGTEMLKYIVLGLAIIFVGRGFVALIKSIILLGGNGTSTSNVSPTPTIYTKPGSYATCTTLNNNKVCNNDSSQTCLQNYDCNGQHEGPKCVNISSGHDEGDVFQCSNKNKACKSNADCGPGADIGQSCASALDCRPGLVCHQDDKLCAEPKPFLYIPPTGN